MMPDLGKYAVDVLIAYAFGGALLAGIVAISLWQARRARQTLEEAEKE
ncbi:MAG: heme exporter protein CcmD [Rhodobacteraceae bacterium]|nr:heme exporter protein CcmD [Paracoccaceae bacterium]